MNDNEPGYGLNPFTPRAFLRTDPAHFDPAHDPAHGNLTVDKEIIVLLNSFYPDFVRRAEIGKSLSRRNASTVSTALSRLHAAKLIHKEKTTFRLTAPGVTKALEILKRR